MMIIVTAEKFVGTASEEECTFHSVAAAEKALTALYGCPGESVRLMPGEYREEETQARHTPAPWKKGKLVDQNISIYASLGAGVTHCVANICACPRCVKERNAEGNARLIEAAPELLAALATLINIGEEAYDLTDDHAHADVIAYELDEARAAITKAKGE
jgi:hypothetical protein